MTAFSDGRAVNVQAPFDIAKGDFMHVDGWNGIAQETKNSGEYLAMEIASDRMHYVTLPDSITYTDATIGKIVYVDTSGDLTLTASTNMPALKIIESADLNNVAGVRVLNVDVPPA